MKSEDTAALAEALAKAQGEIKNAAFNRVNPHFKNKYADLASILDALRGPFAKNQLAISQTTEVHEGNMLMVTYILHSSGQWLRAEYPLPSAVRPQELGSALTYARRYSLSSIAGISADDDDDAEGAEKPNKTLPKKDARDIYMKMQGEVDGMKSRDALKAWGEENADRIKVLPEDWQDILRLRYEEKKAELRQKEAAHPADNSQIDLSAEAVGFLEKLALCGTLRALTMYDKTIAADVNELSGAEADYIRSETEKRRKALQQAEGLAA